MNNPVIKLHSPEQTEAVGQAIGQLCQATLVIYLIGNLGAGKTTLSRGILNACGHVGTVKSPTYTLIEPYELADKTILHADFYRLGDPEEVVLLGLDDFLSRPCIWLIEWPDNVIKSLPPPDISLNLSIKPSYHALSWVNFSTKGELITEKLTQIAEVTHKI